MKDTICAISTPVGEAGIGIVRLSGKKALKIADRIFMPKNGKKPSQLPGYTVHYGHIAKRSDAIIDEVLLVIMRAPKSYTKEDIIEINAHGGITCLRKILDLVVSKGARLAEPGEFTKRAFLNGRIDLSQAEAVLDVITARTETSLRAARRQLDGELSQAVKKIRDGILDIQANVEATLDFPEDGLETLEKTDVKIRLDKVISELKQLLGGFQNGKVLREGITTVICGKPNVGKSTLMNRFLRQKRVIVTPVPGTTRDAIEEIVNVRGIPLKIVDTAGIMHAKDEPSKEGVERSKKYMESADLILLVFDSSDELTKEDMDIIDTVKTKKILVIINKTDLPERLQVGEVKRHLCDKKIIRISAEKDKNLDRLYDVIYDMIWSGGIESSHQLLLTNVRHAAAIEKALHHLDAAKTGVVENTGMELIAVDLKDAKNQLGLITGETFTDDLLDRIFSQFCIGK